MIENASPKFSKEELDTVFDPFVRFATHTVFIQYGAVVLCG